MSKSDTPTEREWLEGIHPDDPRLPSDTKQLSDEIYKHMYALFSMEEVKPDELDYRYNQVMNIMEDRLKESDTKARKEAYSLGFETAKKTYTYKMVPCTQLLKVYQDIAIAYQQSTGIEYDLFIGWLHDKAEGFKEAEL